MKDSFRLAFESDRKTAVITVEGERIKAASPRSLLAALDAES